MNETLNSKPMTLRGQVTLCHRRNGVILSIESFCNTITTMGKDQVSGLINGARATAFTRLALGTSETAAVVGDIALKVEIAAGSLARAASTCTQITTDTTNDTAYLVHSWTATASYTVKECGIVNSATGGRILGRKTFTGKAMESSDTLTVYYAIDVD